MAAIELKEIFLIHDDRILLNRLNAEIGQGGVSALLGAYASGKSALIRVIGCLETPTAGDALVFGNSVRKKQKKVHALVGIAPEENNTTPGITVYRQLEIIAGARGLRGKKARDRIIELMSVFGLSEYADQEASALSGGYLKRLSIAMALIHSPKILLLDEPTEGLDAVAAGQIRELIRMLGTVMTVIFSTKSPEEAKSTADTVYVLSNGLLSSVEPGTPDAL